MSKAKFVPKDGQVDFTNARYCPVINCVVENNGRLLLVKRSKDLRLYPSYWNGISGFLDDKQSIEAKAQEELGEELNIKPTNIQEITQKTVLIQEDPNYNKTWIVFPVHVKVNTNKYKLDREASEAKWVSLRDARKLNLLPGFSEVLDNVFDR
jgi:isopentenyldiphosphate isomerase